MVISLCVSLNGEKVVEIQWLTLFFFLNFHFTFAGNNHKDFPYEK